VCIGHDFAVLVYDGLVRAFVPECFVYLATREVFDTSSVGWPCDVVDVGDL